MFCKNYSVGAHVGSECYSVLRKQIDTTILNAKAKLYCNGIQLQVVQLDVVVVFEVYDLPMAMIVEVYFVRNM
jgi:hypothetical protein